jgi:hypothetical protein
MQVQFSLKMRNARIRNEYFDYVELEWKEDLTPRQLAVRFHTWLSDNTFISTRLPDLQDAAYCQLFINPQS